MFWVLQEDILNTTSTVTEEIGGTLATAITAITTRSITVRQKDVFYLMRDHQVSAEGTTTVPFPKDCRDMCVVGYVNWRSGKREDKRVLSHFKRQDLYSCRQRQKNWEVHLKGEKALP